MKRISEFFKPAAPSAAKKTKTVDVNETEPSSSSSSADAEGSKSAKKREFQQKWLTDERFKSWLRYDEKQSLMLCSICELTGKKNPLVTGSQNFRTSTLERHMSSADHVNSLIDRKSQSVMKTAVKTAFDKKHESLVAAIRTVYWLCKEQIATVKYSSAINFLKLQKCPYMESLFSGRNATYESDRAAEEFQDAICLVIEKKLKENIVSSNVVSLMCDESDDISTQKKLVIYVRFIPEGSFEPETHYLDNVSIDKGDAETVYKNLKASACSHGVDMKKVMFFGSDGASVMTGRKSGVSARLIEDQPLVLNIHCMAHKLALCTSQAADGVSYLKKYKEILINIFYYFKHSSLRTSNLSKIEDVLQDKKLKIKEVHSVRWFAFFSALEAIFHTWSSLVTYFEQEKQAEKGGSAKGIHSQITHFEFVGVTYLLMDIMPILTKLSLSFQKKDIDIAIVQPLVQSTISQLEYLVKHDGHYMGIFQTALIENKLKIRDHTVSATKNQKTHLQNIRQEFIQQVILQLQRRFPQDDTSVIKSLAILGMRGISFVDKDKLSDHGKEDIQLLCDTYGVKKGSEQVYIDPCQVKLEWELLKSLVIQQRYPTDSIYILWKILFENHKDLIPNLVKLAELALIAPLQTSDCERGFSTQNDIKTADRNRLCSDRLSKLMRISMNKDSVEDFDYDKAVQEWRAVKDRRAFTHM